MDEKEQVEKLENALKIVKEVSNTLKQPAVQLNRKNKKGIMLYIEPTDKKILKQIALDHDKTQTELLEEGLKYIIEKYKK